VRIPRRFLDGIAEGSVDLAFRRWTRPMVRTGGRQRTPIGELAIDDVRRVARAAVTAAEARRAGYATRAELLRVLDRRDEGRIYRVQLRLAGPDPRVALRERADIDAAGLVDIRMRLAFKRDVRKLKELGLTESLERGYRLSPRGRAVLERLDD
jgi:hypothetical protein